MPHRIFSYGESLLSTSGSFYLNVMLNKERNNNQPSSHDVLKAFLAEIESMDAELEDSLIRVHNWAVHFSSEPIEADMQTALFYNYRMAELLKELKPHLKQLTSAA